MQHAGCSRHSAGERASPLTKFRIATIPMPMHWAIQQEACEILGVRALRDYFHKPAAFFDDHLKRYAKSRRQAPIYWPRSTPSGSYTLWLYYHRLTDQTLYSCVNDFVEPKLMQARAAASRLRQKAGSRRAEERELEQLDTLEHELAEFHAELLWVRGVLEAQPERRRADHRRAAVEAVSASRRAAATNHWQSPTIWKMCTLRRPRRPRKGASRPRRWRMRGWLERSDGTMAIVQQQPHKQRIETSFLPCGNVLGSWCEQIPS